MRSDIRFALAAVMCLVGSAPLSAQASPPGPRDYFLNPPAPGLWANVDLFTVGAQASLEYRQPIAGDLGMFTARGSGMASLGYGEGAAHADFRLALLSVGGSVGYRDVWRNYPVPPGQLSTYKLRRQIDEGKEGVPERNRANWPWAEGRLRLVLPLGWLWFVANGALRWEDAPANSYDWFHTNVHDGGRLGRADSTLFFRHERYGAVGPTVRYMNLPRGGERRNELAFGFTLGTRPGLRSNADLLLLQFLTIPSSSEFGFHALRAPVFALLIYRLSFGLSVPSPEG